MEEDIRSLSGNIVDVLNSKIYPGTLKISNGRIIDIIKESSEYKNYILPGFVDSHVHIESSMLIPSEFARVAVIHGTVAAVSDPHEIANVLGIDGVKYMIENGKTTPMKFYFGAPSCVPASTFETSGASIGPEELEELLKLEEIKYLGEVMNFPGVLSGDSILHKKISIAKKYSKLIDGHAPGLRGKGLMQYIDAGITTDHECLTKDEALEKIRLGMKVQIREGSAAKNAKDLMSIIDEHCEDCMFCSDDKHPDDLAKGHINDLVKMALNSGIDMMKVLTVACVNPVLHYKLDVGILQKGDSGDFLLVDNLHDFKILSTYINGQIVAGEGKSLINKVPSTILNNFNVGKKKKVDFALPRNKGNINVIEAIDGGLITNKLILIPKIVNGYAVSDVERDILKIAVVNRYSEEEVAIGFIKNFGLKKGAIASSVAHDSQNVIAVGVTDEDICRAVNLIIENKGGISAISEEKEMVLPLPIAGIMSNEDYSEVVNKYGAIDNMAKSLGSTLHAPFMTLSFMALLVIPKIKLSDMGLFDSEKFQFINIFEKQ
ncbi:MAG: adenine deaminase [Deltaproteobacteria bacterium]|nr:MAG: adenine deaminase [Deltaproteobacteria bacterium]